ncbi:MAG: hypothetical protein RJA70_2870, partial [Pseudomonadota bacterium]
RVQGSLAAAYSPYEPLILAFDMQGRGDLFSGGAGAEFNLYGEPRLLARFARSANKRLYWGLEADLRLIGGEAPSIDFAASSPSGRGLLGVQVAPGTWMGAQLGLHLDRSAVAVPEPQVLTSNDRRTLGASSWTGLVWGLGASYVPASLETEFVGELTGEVLSGRNAPSVTRSPWHIGFGARHPLREQLSLSADIEVGLSRRPLEPLVEDLLPMEPRVSVGVGVLWRFGVPPTPPAAPARPERPPPGNEPKPRVTEVSAAELISSPVSGAVVDEGGRALADASVTLEMLGREPHQERTLADGKFEFAAVPEGEASVRVNAPGYEEALVQIAEGKSRVVEVMLRPSVPAGQVRGKVLDLKGNPVKATLRISPGDQLIETQADGSFELELAPGRYTVRFEHEDFGSQRRTISVQNRGVVILNIALSQ